MIGLPATGALLKKARIGGIFSNNCDCDESNVLDTSNTIGQE